MADVTIPAAAFAGVVSFLSPCVLPLVPGYLAFVSGTGQAQAAGDAVPPTRVVLPRAAAFVLGFTSVFVVMGASATGIGQLLSAHAETLSRVLGVVVIVFGLHLLGVFHIPLLYREKRVHARDEPRSLAGAYVIGTGFGFGWTPCIGPILGGVLAMAAVQQTVWHGIGLLIIYSAGLGIPFLAAAMAAERVNRSIRRFGRLYKAVEVGSALLLVGVGALLLFGQFTWLNAQLGFLQRFAL